MVAWKYKLWRTAGAAAALGLAACGNNAPTGAGGPREPSTPPPSSMTGESAIGESGGEGGGTASDAAFAGLQGQALTAQRLQHLRGYVLAAERALADNRGNDASSLLQVGLAEAYAPAKADFGAFDSQPIEAAANASAPTPAQVRASEAVIETAQRQLTADHAEMAARMVDLASSLYQVAAKSRTMDSIEYQSSYGAVLAAQQTLMSAHDALRTRDARGYDDSVTQMNRLVALWLPGAAPANPTPVQDVVTQSSRVRLALSALL